tara:strand:+ start:740 stop:973 length:234 start_codon:yes stop_codon:yes gene_type:complete
VDTESIEGLFPKNGELRELSVEHHKLDERLNELTKRHYLSKPEQVEQTNLKKLKLKIKDRIENIVRQLQSDTVASGE